MNGKYRQNLPPDWFRDAQAFPKEFLREVLSQAELIFVNEEESRMLQELFGCDLDSMLQTQKAKAVITTMGSAGTVC